jgi:hypothetical protein
VPRGIAKNPEVKRAKQAAGTRAAWLRRCEQDTALREWARMTMALTISVPDEELMRRVKEILDGS